MKTSQLVEAVGQVLVMAAQSNELRSSVTAEVLAIGRQASSAEEFIGACRTAEKAWREETKAEKLPQPYSNAKSVVKYALKADIPLLMGKGKVPKTYNGVREEVSAHRKANSEAGKGSPERHSFQEAARDILASGDATLLAIAASTLQGLAERFAEIKPPAPAVKPDGVKPQAPELTAH